MQTELFYGVEKNDKGVYSQFIRMDVEAMSIAHIDTLESSMVYSCLDESESKDYYKLTPSNIKFMLQFEKHVAPEILAAINKGRKKLYFSDSQLNTIFELIIIK